MKEELTIWRCGDVHVFSLNRPASGNSLSPGLVESLHKGLDAFERVAGRVLVLQGEGRNFCTGFDLSDAGGATDGDLLLRFVRIEQFLARIWAAPYATIAVGQGRVVGAGADLFAACGSRIALTGATFRFPGAAFGLVLGTRRLCVRIGQGDAQRLVTSGAVIDADVAARTGLATRIVATVDLQSALDDEIASATRLDRVTFEAIRRVTGDEAPQLDSDLAALVRSASRPGLAERIVAFRADARGASRAVTAGERPDAGA